MWAYHGSGHASTGYTDVRTTNERWDGGCAGTGWQTCGRKRDTDPIAMIENLLLEAADHITRLGLPQVPQVQVVHCAGGCQLS